MTEEYLLGGVRSRCDGGRTPSAVHRRGGRSPTRVVPPRSEAREGSDWEEEECLLPGSPQTPQTPDLVDPPVVLPDHPSDPDPVWPPDLL